MPLGVYIRPNENALAILMNTYDKVLEEVIVDNLPVHKWMLLTVRVQNKSLDVYINGLLVKRHELSGTGDKIMAKFIVVNMRIWRILEQFTLL